MTDDSILQALLDLCKAVGDHPDSMTDAGSLHAAFIKAVGVVQNHSKQPRELTNVIEIPL